MALKQATEQKHGPEGEENSRTERADVEKCYKEDSHGSKLNETYSFI